MSIRGDQFIMSEVMYQLLKNAVLFNKPGGTVTIQAKSLPVSQMDEVDIITNGDADQNVTVIEIEDSGIGIPQTDLKKIFDKFYQVREHLTRDVGGLGLGLTIAQRGIEQHSGQLTVSSKLGEGSTFRVVLPHISELRDVSIDSRPDVAHQQTLVYAKDMARAVTSQLKMKKQLEQVGKLSSDLNESLKQLAAMEPDDPAYNDILCQTQDITQKLAELSNQDS